MRHPLQPQKGSLILVVLCLLTVLGIGLAAFLAVSKQSLTLSNRSQQTGLSAQLAEMGLEEALRAFNKNDWSNWSSNPTNVTSGAWTLDTTNKRATRTITFNSPKFGQGVTGTVKLRIDNYDAAQLDSIWSSATSYRINDLVGYNGIWYRCVKNHSNQTPPNITYWVQDPIPWQWRASSAYENEEVVNYDGTWYRCTANHTSPAAWTGTNWTSIPILSTAWDSTVSYTGNSIAYSGGTWYRDINFLLPILNQVPLLWPLLWTPAEISWRWRGSPATAYSFNDVVYYNGIWYRCILGHNSNTTTRTTTNATYWTNALAAWAWSSTVNYNLNDVVYSGGSFYRCILAHTNQGPPNSTYWSNAPRKSNSWDFGREYITKDTTYYNGVWYLCLNSNTGQNPSTATTYWVSSGNSGYYWNSTTAYSVGDCRTYGSVWYRCLVAHTNKTPNNSTYWTALGAPVIYAEGTATLPDGSAAIKTQLRAVISAAPLFPNAVAATGNLTISTGTGTVDSYDSTLAAYSAGSAGTSAVLAAGSTLAITGTTAVKGYLAWPSPPAGISSGTTINGVAFSTDKSRVSRSPYIPQFDTFPSPNLSSAFGSANFPKGTEIPAATTSGSTLNLGTPGATTPSKYYYDADLYLRSLSSTEYQTININGPVILYVNGYLRIGSSGTIYVNSTGSAEIHVGTRLRVDTGSNGIVNRAPSTTNPDPKKIVLICDSTSSSTQFYDDPSNDFYGVIYAPNLTSTNGLTIGTAGTGVVIFGAVSAKKITFTNEATVHYDTSLRYATFGGIDTPFVISRWRELTDPAERAVLP